MSNVPQQSSSRQFLRELAVPCIMVVAIALFICDSTHLSYEALVFPVVLVVVVLAALGWALVVYLKGDGPAGQPAEGDDDEGGPIIAATPWLLVALPAVLVASFNTLGVLPALVLLVFGGQAIFSFRSPLRSLLIAIAVVAPTYAVFKYILYARFPAGILGIG
jgi:Tripartite tricarboxylate transporter TctB family